MKTRPCKRTIAAYIVRTNGTKYHTIRTSVPKNYRPDPERGFPDYRVQMTLRNSIGLINRIYYVSN